MTAHELHGFGFLLRQIIRPTTIKAIMANSGPRDISSMRLAYPSFRPTCSLTLHSSGSFGVGPG
jgi:hypothetical protein